jgi:hypothetical protein
MKFRKGGKLAKADTFYYGDSKLEMVNSFEYLGVTFQTKGGFSKHVLSKVNKCAVASCAIKNIPQLSLSAALQLFKIKILPIAAYAISAFWSDLTSKNFYSDLDKIKYTFLKRALCLHISTSNRKVMVMCATRPLSEDIAHMFLLPLTDCLSQHLAAVEERIALVDPSIYQSIAVQQTRWRNPCQKHRHVVTRFSAHGFHHLLCCSSGWHSPKDSCKCKICGESAAHIYHLLDCRENSIPLCDWADKLSRFI